MTEADKLWYWYDGSAVQGPCTAEQLRQEPLLTVETQVCAAGEEVWTAFGACAELQAPPEPAPAPPQPAPEPEPQPVTKPEPVRVVTVRNEVVPAARPAAAQIGRKTAGAALLAVFAAGGGWWYWNSTRQATATAVAEAPAEQAADRGAAAGDTRAAAQRQLLQAENALERYPTKTTAICRQLIKQYPHMTEAHVLLARGLERLGNSEAALRNYRNALLIEPDNEQVLEAIERLAPSTENQEAPVDDYSAMMARAHAIIAQAREQPGDSTAAALKALLAATDDEHIRTSGNEALGNLYLALGREAEAAEAFVVAHKAGIPAVQIFGHYLSYGARSSGLTPALAQTLQEARELMTSDNLVQAESKCRSVISRNGQCAEAWELLSQLASKARRYDESSRAREMSDQLKRKERRRAQEKAQRWLQLQYRATPDDQQVIELYINCLEEQTRIPQAVTVCRAAARAANDQPTRERWNNRAEQLLRNQQIFGGR